MPGLVTPIAVAVPPALQAALDSGLPRESLHQAMGAGIAALLKSHFRRRNAVRNSKGWPRSNYWNKARESVAVEEVTDERATVAVRAPGIALHLHGGTVRPVRAGALAIPLRPEVRDANPREGTISGLFVLSPRKSGRAFLAGRGPDGRVRLYWLLLKSSTHLPDSSVLPSGDDLRAAASKAAASAARAWAAAIRKETTP